MILRRISKVILNMDIFATVRLFYEKIMKFRSDIPCRGIYIYIYIYIQRTGFRMLVAGVA